MGKAQVADGVLNPFSDSRFNSRISRFPKFHAVHYLHAKVSVRVANLTQE